MPYPYALVVTPIGYTRFLKMMILIYLSTNQTLDFLEITYQRTGSKNELTNQGYVLENVFSMKVI